MSEKIVGIEVQIGGDTSGLSSALSKTNKEINATQKELFQVERLLKLDPSNTELLAQKQQLLSKAINDTSTKVEALKKAKANADKQMKDGTNVNQEEYRKLQREIVASEQSLGKLETESKKASKGIKEVGDKASSSSKMLDGFGNVAGTVGKGLATVGATALGLVTSLGAVEESTREYRTDMSKLETNTKQAGLSFDKMKENLASITSLTDETDSSIEALSNLMQTGFDDATIEKTLESLSGAIIAFPDTIKIESLADGLQETLATGSATGQFGELLERCGMNLDDFNAKLSKAGTTEQKQKLILETLAKTGMAEVNASYREANENLLTIKEAQFAFNDAMATLGTIIEPVTAQVMGFGAELVNTLTSAYEEGGFEALVSAFGIVLNEILNKIVEFLPQLITMGMNIINSLLNGIQQNLPQIVSSALQTLNTFITTLLGMLPQILQIGITILVELINGIAQQMPTLIPTIVECVLLIVQTLLDNIDSIIQAGINILTALIQGILESLPLIIEKLPEIITTIITVITDNLPLIIEAGIMLLGMLIVGIIECIPQLVESLPQIITAIVNGLTNGITKIAEVGKNIVEGLWNGILMAKDWLFDKVWDFAMGILDTIMSALGIESPSKVFRDKVGTNIALGVRVGFKNSMKQVATDMSNVMEDLTSSIQNQVFVGNIPDVTPRITSESNYITKNYSNTTEIVRQPTTVVLEIDKKELGRIVVPAYDTEKVRLGVSLA